MTREKHTFTQRLRVQLLIAAVIFVLATALSFSYIALRTVDFTDARMTILAAKSYVNRLDSGEDTKLPNEPEMRGFTSWQQIPEQLQQPFTGMDLEFDEITETTYVNPEGNEVYIGIVPVRRNTGETLYFISEYGFSETNDAYDEIIHNFLLEAVWLLACMFLILFLFVFWLLKRATEPMTMLSAWTKDLQLGKPLPDPDFAIVEVDDIARQLKQDIDRLAAFNEREKQFLKYASHELRTPQATVQACLDTLKLQLDGAKLKTVERALRANLTMARLSSALLWLSRESTDKIDKEFLDASALFQRLLSENQHLIKQKNLNVKADISTSTIEIEKDLFDIVLSNLIRNACQHSPEGDVLIQITDRDLNITNSISNRDHKNEVDSFGLGLHLVASICNKIGWRFTFEQVNNKVTATVRWHHCD